MAKYRADLYGLKLRGGATRASHSAFKGRASVQSPVQCSHLVDAEQLVKNGFWNSSFFWLSFTGLATPTKSRVSARNVVKFPL